MNQAIRIERRSGAALEHYVPELARLRIEVFRDFPYLYDGDYDYEKNTCKLISIPLKALSYWHLMAIKWWGLRPPFPCNMKRINLKSPFLSMATTLQKFFIAVNRF